MKVRVQVVDITGNKTVGIFENMSQNQLDAFVKKTYNLNKMEYLTIPVPPEGKDSSVSNKMHFNPNHIVSIRVTVLEK